MFDVRMRRERKAFLNILFSSNLLFFFFPTGSESGREEARLKSDGISETPPPEDTSSGSRGERPLLVLITFVKIPIVSNLASRYLLSPILTK